MIRLGTDGAKNAPAPFKLSPRKNGGIFGAAV
jgi:hypothetical protein